MTTRSSVVRVGHTSLTVHVQVYAERDVDGPRCLKVTGANLTYVAVGPDPRPRPVQPP